MVVVDNRSRLANVLDQLGETPSVRHVVLLDDDDQEAEALANSHLAKSSSLTIHRFDELLSPGRKSNVDNNNKVEKEKAEEGEQALAVVEDHPPTPDDVYIIWFVWVLHPNL